MLKKLLTTLFNKQNKTLLLKNKQGEVVFVGTLRQLRRRFQIQYGAGRTQEVLETINLQGYTLSSLSQSGTNVYNTRRMDNVKKKLKEIPNKPGVYEFLNKDGEIIYIGKAKNLKSRVTQYFGKHDNRPQLPYLIQEAADIKYTVVNNELESLFLENTLIKKHLPKYNIQLRDDKNYAFITIDYNTEIPRIGYARKVDQELRIKDSSSAKATDMSLREPGTGPARSAPRITISDKQGLKIKYFGPYSAAYKIRNTLSLMRRIFPFCAADKVSARPCFYYYLHRCPGVCIGKISLEEYKQQLDRIADFLNGNTSKIKTELKAEMKIAASKHQFEKAARLRDQLQSLELLDERQTVIMPKLVSWDVISAYTDQGYACINLFKVRGGKLYDKENFVYESGVFRRHSDPALSNATQAVKLHRKDTIHADNNQDAIESAGEESTVRSFASVQPFTAPDSASNFAKASSDLRKATSGKQDDTIQETIETFLQNYYLDTSDVPKEIYIEGQVEDISVIEQLLYKRFARKIKINIPQRGKANELIRLGRINAEEYLKKWFSDKAGQLDKINAALDQLKDVLNLPHRPERIECYDISNIQGTNAVGSMVVFKNGLPAKSEYRKFKIRSKSTPDDFAMMKEMLTRRFSRVKDEGLRIKDAWPAPNLIVIDGGKGQLSAALEVLHQFPILRQAQDRSSNLQFPIIGLAKRIEEIFLPGNPEPIVLDHDQPALQLLQRLRDEAHRFGITYHRSLRSKQAVKSALDDIPGIGPKTKKLLKQKFGTVANIKKASFEDLAAVVGERIAQTITMSL